ncbi:MAG TPA: alpha/beta hydrolase, partial [Puia sp.]|nr:alpha/beta hydrolase [Puia sp.]
MKVYFISGLGADKRIFKYVSLPDGFEAVCLDWLTPVKNEELSGYALRMAEKIDQSEPFILAGLSLGGMIASELSEKIKPVFTLLISSVPISSQLPPYIRFASKLNLLKIVPIGFLKSTALAKRLLQVMSHADVKLMSEMLKDTNPFFIRWGMKAISRWKNETLPIPYAHIHGTWDRVLPIRYTHPTRTIKRGGHAMIINKVDEINDWLKEEL